KRAKRRDDVAGSQGDAVRARRTTNGAQYRKKARRPADRDRRVRELAAVTNDAFRPSRLPERRRKGPRRQHRRTPRRRIAVAFSEPAADAKPLASSDAVSEPAADPEP